MTNPAYEATNSGAEKLTRALVASAMLSSIEDYLFEILDSVENDIGKLTAEDSYTLNAWVRSAVEKAAEELESQPLCVKSDTPMREAAPLCVKLPDSSSKAFWSGTGKTEQFHPETYKRWVKEAIERAGDIAGIQVEVK